MWVSEQLTHLGGRTTLVCVLPVATNVAWCPGPSSRTVHVHVHVHVHVCVWSDCGLLCEDRRRPLRRASGGQLQLPGVQRAPHAGGSVPGHGGPQRCEQHLQCYAAPAVRPRLVRSARGRVRHVSRGAGSPTDGRSCGVCYPSALWLLSILWPPQHLDAFPLHSPVVPAVVMLAVLAERGVCAAVPSAAAAPRLLQPVPDAVHQLRPCGGVPGCGRRVGDRAVPQLARWRVGDVPAARSHPATVFPGSHNTQRQLIAQRIGGWWVVGGGWS
jgi:hypothetical protein